MSDRVQVSNKAATKDYEKGNFNEVRKASINFAEQYNKLLGQMQKVEKVRKYIPFKIKDNNVFPTAMGNNQEENSVSGDRSAQYQQLIETARKISNQNQKRSFQKLAEAGQAIANMDAKLDAAKRGIIFYKTPEIPRNEYENIINDIRRKLDEVTASDNKK